MFSSVTACVCYLVLVSIRGCSCFKNSPPTEGFCHQRVVFKAGLQVRWSSPVTKY